MGADIHVVLGKINMAAIENRQNLKESESTAVALFGKYSFEPDDFELMDLPDELEIYRNSKLFAFLANVRGNVKPYYLGYDRIERTDEFIRWLDRKLIEADRKAGKPGVWYGQTSEMQDLYDLGEHSRIIHVVSNLVAFDYDQVAEICDKEERWSKDARYYRPENGETYRELFGDNFFELLKYCQDNGWHFIIFGFDS